MTLFLAALGLYLGGGLLGLALWRRPRAALVAGAGGATAAAAAGLPPVLSVLAGGPAPRLDLAWAVPGGALSLSLDPLAAAFLLPVFALSALFAIYGVGYLASQAGRRNLGVPVFFYGLLCASMAILLAARNGVLFLVGWESMSLASFFLVAFEDDQAEVRAASRVYFVATHLGTLFLLVLFSLLGRRAGSLSFDAFASVSWGPAEAGVLLGLALVGFGTKAGFWPLHVWLPRAHPAAPSHVSALMSGVMIKTGIYGVCRMLTLLGPPQASWGLVLLGIGLVSGVLGVLYALVQHDLKALLAYHSVENIGIISLGLGVGVLGSAHGRPAVAAAGFAGALLHVWNHGIFKGLLFLGAGSVLHATGTRDLERLGGLWKKMPLTGATFLVGATAICGLPPLNGLVSEWLVYMGFLRAGTSVAGLPGLAALASAAGLALVGGLALACFAKAVGVVFLGEPRSGQGRGAREAGPAMAVPLVVLAALCVAIGVLPTVFVGLLGPAVCQLAPGCEAAFAELSAWNGPLGSLGFFAAGLAALCLVVLGVRRRALAGRPVAASPTWDCGYAAPTARMQYTASSFAAPLSGLFRTLVRTHDRTVLPEGYFPKEGSLATHPVEAAEAHLWRPLFRSAGALLGRLRFLQSGRVQSYLIYIFVTLLALLIWALAS